MREVPFYISGESYAGKYIPVFMKGIHEHNKKASNKLRLDGILVGNGFVDTTLQRSKVRELALSSGAVALDWQKEQLEALEKRCFEYQYSQPDKAYKECAKITKYPPVVDGGIDILDVREFVKVMDVEEAMISEYLKRDKVMEDLNMDSKSGHTFNLMCDECYDALVHDGMNDFTSFYEEELTRTSPIPIFIFAGNYDMLDGPYGTERWMENLHKWAGLKTFEQQSRKLYYYQNPSGETRIGGYYVKNLNLNFLIIHAAGHMVPIS